MMGADNGRFPNEQRLLNQILSHKEYLSNKENFAMVTA